jgi:hypothetical protein
MNIHDPVWELLHVDRKSGWIDWAAGIVGLIVRHSALKVSFDVPKREVVMRHPEIEPTRDVKPTWKDILIGIMGFLALAALIAWNQVDGNSTQSASNTRIGQHTASE